MSTETHAYFLSDTFRENGHVIVWPGVYEFFLEHQVSIRVSHPYQDWFCSCLMPDWYFLLGHKSEAYRWSPTFLVGIVNVMQGSLRWRDILTLWEVRWCVFRMGAHSWTVRITFETDMSDRIEWNRIIFVHSCDDLSLEAIVSELADVQPCLWWIIHLVFLRPVAFSREEKLAQLRKNELMNMSITSICWYQ